MNRKQQTNYVLVLSGIAISAILVASLLILSGQFTQKALAQGADKTNTTGKTASQTGISAVINATKNTTATSAATKNIINATGNMTNKTG